MAPTRELARQIMAVVNAMGKYTDVKTDYAIKTESRVTEPVTAHVVVGTPGTMADYIKRRIIDPTTVKVLVLDEADSMLDQENLSEQCLKIKKYVLKISCSDHYMTQITDLVCSSASCRKRITHRLSYSLQLSRIVCGISQVSSLQTRTRSSSRRRSCRSRGSSNSTWIARTKNLNMIFWCKYITCSLSGRALSSPRYCIIFTHLLSRTYIIAMV